MRGKTANYCRQLLNDTLSTWSPLSSFLHGGGRELWRWGRILGCRLGGVTGNLLFIISTCGRLEIKRRVEIRRGIGR
jgi:hypothetical protein